MKKLSLIAMLAVLTLGVVACKPATSSSETPAPSTSQPTSSEPVSSEPVSSEEGTKLPVAWDAEDTYQRTECSVTILPGEDNPTAKAVKDYFTTPGIRFIDLRDETEGYGVGHIERFESISFFNLICGTTGQLFTKNADGTFKANYTQSVSILKSLFPTDATLFLMCQAGGRVVTMMQLLEQYDYDMSKIYNVGGWNDIKSEKDFGGYGVSLGLTEKATAIEYNFSKLTPVAAETPAAAKRSADLPTAWDAEDTYQRTECSVTILPGEDNPTAKAVKDYFTTPGIRFIDLRDETEGYGVGHIERFESISFFNLICGTTGQLFTKNADGTFKANYTQSVSILKSLFPTDATLFLMCQAGGRVVTMMQLLEQYDYDMSKIYNVGGWNDIKSEKDFGGYGVSLGLTEKAKSISYNFSKLTPVAA